MSDTVITSYDSRDDTIEHIGKVIARMSDVIGGLQQRALVHDQSKLRSPEKDLFDIGTPKLWGTTYGSLEYKNNAEEISSALVHHYETNTHHPEHYENGINGMSLLDIVEMFCDWRAAVEKHKDGNFEESLRINKERFQMSDQLAQIFENTRRELGW